MGIHRVKGGFESDRVRDHILVHCAVMIKEKMYKRGKKHCKMLHVIGNNKNKYKEKNMLELVATSNLRSGSGKHEAGHASAVFVF